MFRAAVILTLVLSTPVFALENGTYDCSKGNENSICPQKVDTVLEKKKLVGLKIFYSGYCNDQGPFYYDCEDGVCGDGQIEFSKIKKTSYHWQNLPHGFFCDFVKR